MLLISIVSFAVLYLGYRFYASYLEKLYSVKPDEKMPSKELYDGIDYVPTNKFILLGHHFSSIAGAGPIVGPIIAGIAFGWAPAVLWVLIGTIFIGGLHDYSSLIISIRHKGKSIGEVANLYINKRTYKLFLLFTWLALMYVVAVFADITADTFAKEAAVSQISIIYIFVAFVFGSLLFRKKAGLSLLTILSLAALLAGGVLSFKYQVIFLDKNVWIMILLAYCVLASLLPVWLLLQPRDYLSSYLLYASVFLGLIGLFFGGHEIRYPAFVSFSSESVGTMFPFLFVTIACGAVSGFHSLVASGTTSKQIDKIENARFVGYGGMVLEAVVAIIALGTVMLMASDNPSLKSAPAEIFASGLASFSTLTGLPPAAGKTFGFLVVSAFMLTTLDTATRIARYIFQEMIDKTVAGAGVKLFATLISLSLPLALLNLRIAGPSGTPIPCWKIIWPLFGITNQLLAALVLIIIYLWAKKENSVKGAVIALPAFFMIVTTISALFLSLKGSVSAGSFNIVFYIAAVLLLLSAVVLFESLRAVFKKPAV
ncbi:MAG: carbon starvation protein A [Elusimicrobia bacterium CG08_land_8_20_14_0_20_51_18]|nr:MAG: carbon starvation protein A [Elusimicrobia bacterium CG08_land_8_20_14_0_20_51_18]